MGASRRIRSYIQSLPEPKRSDLRRLHELVLELAPDSKLWFLDGKDESGKVVSNPSIGYGSFEKAQANGKTREFYQVGISANSAGLTVYMMSISDRAYLKETYNPAIGKAEITGYCIKFRALKNVDLQVLMRAIHDGLQRTRA
jgi:hypothetical protein